MHGCPTADMPNASNKGNSSELSHHTNQDKTKDKKTKYSPSVIRSLLRSYGCSPDELSTLTSF